MLSTEAQEFISKSPFLFIASRAKNGQIDVSPRGDDPQVLAVRSPTLLVLPDRAGNNRLDTISNMLDQPEVSLAVIGRDCDRFLRIHARSMVSADRKDLEPFEVRGQSPLSVAKLTVRSARFISTVAFEEACFWTPSRENRAPLDLFGMIKDQLAFHAASGYAPEQQYPSSVEVLQNSGFQDAYRTPSYYVGRKSFARFDPHTTNFLASCRFAVLAFSDIRGEINFAFVGGKEGFAAALTAGQFLIRSRSESSSAEPLPAGVVGGLFVRPGMPESLRLNGRIVECNEQGDERTTIIESTEMFLHCANSFARSRIWRPQKRLAWNGLRKFLCRARVAEADGVISFMLEPADDWPLEPFHPGQYVTISYSDVEGTTKFQRCYSLSNAPADTHFRITVRRHAVGVMSCWLHDKVNPGSPVMLGAPRGRFRLNETSGRAVALVSAGVGITPMIPILLHLSGAAPPRPVWFVHGTKNSKEHIMRDVVRTLAEKHPNVHTHFTYSRPLATDKAGHDYDQHGRIGIETFEGLFEIRDTDFYLCGPAEFMTSLRSTLVARGVPRQQIKMELFGASSETRAEQDTNAAGGLPSTVSFTKTGIKVPWKPGDGTLLDLAINLGMNPPYVCRAGDCQSCAQRLIGGEVAYPDDLELEPVEGCLLMCQAVPVGDVSIEL